MISKVEVNPLDEISLEALEAEVQRRKELLAQQPKELHTINFEESRKAVRKYVNYLTIEEFFSDESKDYEEDIFERAVEMYYGKTVWDWINKRTETR